MAEHTIDRAIESIEGGNDEHCAAACRQDSAHVPKRPQIIADMFQHVQANDGIRPEFFQFQKPGVQHIHNKRMHMGMRSEIHLVDCDALRHEVDSHHLFSVYKVPCKIPHAATD